MDQESGENQYSQKPRTDIGKLQHFIAEKKIKTW